MSETPLNIAGTLSGTFGQTATSKALRSIQDVVFVDVGSRKIESNVVRDGLPIGVHTIDPDVFRDIVTERPVVTFRVLSQSVPPGTPVPEGTSVDVVMARPGGLPVGVVSGVHVAVRDQTVQQAFATLVANNSSVRRIIARAAEGPLGATDEQEVRRIFQSADIPVTDTPGEDVDAAVETLRMLTTFGGT